MSNKGKTIFFKIAGFYFIFLLGFQTSDFGFQEEFPLVRKIRQFGNINNKSINEELTYILRETIEKIESDIDVTATAFADAQNIQRSLRWTDWGGYFLEKVTTGLKAVAAIITMSNPSQALSELLSNYELPLQVFSGLLSIDSLIRTESNLKLSIEGAGYYSNVGKMLDKAYAESSTRLFFNYQAYKTTIKNYLLGLYGYSPLSIPHRSLSAERNNQEVVYGADAVQKAIKNNFRKSKEKINKKSISSERENEIKKEIERIRRGIVRSKLNGTKIEYGIFNNNISEIWLGNIGELEKARIEALTNLDRNLEREESITISKAISGTMNAVRIFLVPTNPALGKAIGEINLILLIPSGIDLSERIMKTSIYKTNPREQINMIPQEMLLALSKEISDIWMLVDDIVKYIENSLDNSNLYPF